MSDRSVTHQRPRITTVERDGLVLDVIDEGPVDGEPIVLLHGFPERATCWGRVTPALNDAGYRTLALDQRGYAPRARPTRRRDYRASELAADVVALIDAAVGRGGRVHVVGHDWGAFVAWALGQRYPDRLRTLTAVSVPHPAAFRAAFLRSRQLLLSWYMLVFQLPRLPEAVLRRIDRGSDRRLAGAGLTRADIARIKHEVVDSGALSGALGWYRALPFNGRSVTRDRVVGVPTTLVWSDGDVAIARWGAEHTGRWVTQAPYRFVELAGVSHWIPTQAPDLLVEAILDRVEARSA